MQKGPPCLWASLRNLVAGAGFEPTTFGLWARRATRLLHPASTCKNYIQISKKVNVNLSNISLTKLHLNQIGSGSWIWTNDLRVMSPTSYQTAPSRIKNKTACTQLSGSKLVRKGGLEPPRPKALPPQGSVSTNSTTTACACILFASFKKEKSFLRLICSFLRGWWSFSRIVCRCCYR